MATTLAGIVLVITQVLTFAIIARSLLSWFPNAQRSQLGYLLVQVTEPVIAPFRRIIPSAGMLDLAPLAAIIVLQVVGWIIGNRLS
ncbi:MAG: YggT family protein [Chloroflexi bacterium]|nr:YggT family protein [Chloroflexota bacterium]